MNKFTVPSIVVAIGLLAGPAFAKEMFTNDLTVVGVGHEPVIARKLDRNDRAALASAGSAVESYDNEHRGLGASRFPASPGALTLNDAAAIGWANAVRLPVDQYDNESAN